MKYLIAILLWAAICYLFLSLFRINQYENDYDQAIIDRKKSRDTPRC